MAALKGNNAKLTAALLESTANVEQWKQQLAAYQGEAERLHKRVGAHANGGAGGREDHIRTFFLCSKYSHPLGPQKFDNDPLAQLPHCCCCCIRRRFFWLFFS